jgi:hypothetical protein
MKMRKTMLMLACGLALTASAGAVQEIRGPVVLKNLVFEASDANALAICRQLGGSAVKSYGSQPYVFYALSGSLTYYNDGSTAQNQPGDNMPAGVKGVVNEIFFGNLIGKKVKNKNRVSGSYITDLFCE